VEWDEQSLLGERCRGVKIGVTMFPMCEQEWDIAVKDIAARTKVPRRTAAEMR
jgi:hypothetical protein